jgi:hypothetical protein
MIKHFHSGWRSLPVAVADLFLVRLMRAPRKLTVLFLMLCAVAALPLAVIFGGRLFLAFSGHHINRIKEHSPIYQQAHSFAPDWEQRVRDAVLQQLPVGSTRDQIAAFLQKNFNHVQYAVVRTDDSRALAPQTEPHVFIRAIDDTGFPGECRVEIYLLLTPEEHLRDVVVRATEAYV